MYRLNYLAQVYVHDYNIYIYTLYVYVQLIFLWKSDCLGCFVLLCLVVCLTLLASFFLPSSLINMCICVCIAFSCMCLGFQPFLSVFCGIFSLRLVGFLKLDNSELNPISASNALLSGGSAAAGGGVATNGSKDGISQFNHTDSKSGSFGGFIQSARLAVLCTYVYPFSHLH